MNRPVRYVPPPSARLRHEPRLVLSDMVIAAVAELLEANLKLLAEQGYAPSTLNTYRQHNHRVERVLKGTTHPYGPRRDYS